MDVGAGNAADTNQVIDPVGSRCQKLFQDFLEEWQDGEELKYLKAARELVKPERNTLVVSMKDIERFNPGLAQSIQDEYYRLYPFLCAALKNYVTDRADMTLEKEYFVAFSEVDAQLKVRDLTR
jgi:DNA replication licensing factor MCM6